MLPQAKESLAWQTLHKDHRRVFTKYKEYIMEEVLPVAAGAVIGLLVQWVRGPRLRAAVLVLLCLVFGALASFLAGELEVSMAFISVDTVLVFVGALLAVGAVALWRRRARATR
jgi:peptidoglycan/LPS O-acetylase OafA/YrhL